MTFNHSFLKPSLGDGEDRLIVEKDGAGVTPGDSPYFNLAVRQAKAYRDRVVSDHASTVVVVPLVLGPDNVSKVPCGEVRCPRCEADQFQKGRLTITSVDNGYELRSFEVDEWEYCTVYDANGHISYSWSNR